MSGGLRRRHRVRRMRRIKVEAERTRRARLLAITRRLQRRAKTR